MEISGVLLIVVMGVLPLLHRLAIREQSSSDRIATGDGSLPALGGPLRPHDHSAAALEPGWLVRMPEDVTFLPAPADSTQLWIPTAEFSHQVADWLEQGWEEGLAYDGEQEPVAPPRADSPLWHYQGSGATRFGLAIDHSVRDQLAILIDPQTPHFDFERNTALNTARRRAAVAWFILGAVAFVFGAATVATEMGKSLLGIGITWLALSPLFFRGRIPDPREGAEVAPVLAGPRAAPRPSAARHRPPINVQS